MPQINGTFPEVGIIVVYRFVVHLRERDINFWPGHSAKLSENVSTKCTAIYSCCLIRWTQRPILLLYYCYYYHIEFELLQLSNSFGKWTHDIWTVFPKKVCSIILTVECSCSNIRKKDSKSGRPKWVIDRNPVNRLRSEIFWKCRSQMYWNKYKEIQQ